VTTPDSQLGRRRSIVSYVHRGGRMTVGQEKAWERHLGTTGRAVVDLPEGPLDATSWFGRDAPLLLEIGSGMGETTSLLAEAEPETNYLAIDVYQPGVAQLMLRAESMGLANLRVLRGDAVNLLEDHIEPGRLAGARIFYPDPWPKSRHHKRRLVQPGFIGLLASRLAEGAVLHLATDWAEYADQMLEVCTAEPLLRNRHDGWAPRPSWRPVTKFESRAEQEGRTSRDLLFERR